MTKPQHDSHLSLSAPGGEGSGGGASPAFEASLLALRPCLVGIGRDFFGDADRAEDVAQETLMRLWVMRDRIDPAVPVRPLAVRMAKNICVSMWRHERKTVHGAAEDDVGGKTAEAASGMEDSDNARLLPLAMDRLTAGEQRLMRLRNEENMDIGQITAVTGIAPRSVSVMLSRARHKIIEALKKGGHL